MKIMKSTLTAMALASISLLAFSSAQAAQMQQAFSYDAAGRLTGVTSDAGSAKVSLDERYVYDASGNITEKVVAGQTVRMTYDAGNQLMSRTDAAGTVDFVYDSAGRLASERQNGESIAQYQYGYLDKVTQVTRGDQVTQFHYNANGMLVAKERDGQIFETFGWDGIGLIAKDDVVYANEAHVSGGVPLAAIDAGNESSELQYFDSDYLGTTTAVYSATGEVDAKLAGSFGAGTESDEVRFTGKPYDADLDAHVFPFRNYKSEAGRWASADPAGFPDGPNQHYYACVPTMSLDPWGLATVSLLGGVSQGDTIGSLTIDKYETKSYSSQSGAYLKVTPTIGNPGSDVYRWRQYFSITDQDGNYLQWNGNAANSVLDPTPNDDNKDWYWTNSEWNTYKTADGVSSVFSDAPRLDHSRITGTVTAVTMSFSLEFVRVSGLNQANGGSVVNTINWGFAYEM
ncbi:MAG: RHS repeat-associated protein [Lentimonas sp.]|jgi:RHS repeat-associated protein